MALKGTITETGISEVLHLVGLQHRAGAIRFSNGKDIIRLHVKERALAGIEWPARPVALRLGEMLISAQLLTREQLDEALKAEPADAPLGQKLVALGYVEPAAMRDLLELQAHETLHALFDWTDGEYVFDTFEAQEEPSANSAIPPRPIEAVLLEGARRHQLWPIIREKLPSLEQTFDRIREAPGTGEEENAGEDDDLDFESLSDPNDEPTAFDRLDALTVRVDRLVIPGRTVREIIALSRLGTFETCRALSSLITGGYIRVHANVRRAITFEDLVLPVPVQTPISVTAPVRPPIYLLLALFALAVGLMLLQPRAPKTDGLAAHRARVEAEVREQARELYRLQTGAYPAISQ